MFSSLGTNHRCNIYIYIYREREREREREEQEKYSSASSQDIQYCELEKYFMILLFLEKLAKLAWGSKTIVYKGFIRY
jgi:hypothetical protein